jgi:hypothetical protein
MFLQCIEKTKKMKEDFLKMQQAAGSVVKSGCVTREIVSQKHEVASLISSRT